MNLFILKGYWVFFDIIILIISLFFLMYIIFLLGVWVDLFFWIKELIFLLVNEKLFMLGFWFLFLFRNLLECLVLLVFFKV